MLLVPRRDNTYAKAGVVAEVSERLRLSGRGVAVSLTGLHRAMLGSASVRPRRRASRRLEARPDVKPATVSTLELERNTARS